MLDGPTAPVSSPEQSSLSTSTTSSTDYSAASSVENNADSSFTSEEDYQIEDSFWSETLAMTVDDGSDSFGMEMREGDACAATAPSANDDMDFWLKLFMQASDMQNNLPQI
jgi:myb proto-oncogene protein